MWHWSWNIPITISEHITFGERTLVATIILQIRAILLAMQLAKLWCRNVVLSKANLLVPKVESKVNFNTSCLCSGVLLTGLSTNNNFIFFIFFSFMHFKRVSRFFMTKGGDIGELRAQLMEDNVSHMEENRILFCGALMLLLHSLWLSSVCNQNANNCYVATLRFGRSEPGDWERTCPLNVMC